jgi:pantetheine-phosphate adenylyltransferase
MKAIYPGTFDPVTFGHVDLIERGLKIFPELIVGIAEHPAKKPLFSAAERKAMVEEAVGPLPGLTVEIFDNLLVEFARSKGAGTILRGLRAVSDFEYEMQIALTNRDIAEDIETVFVMPSKKHIYLSSSIVKEIARYGGPLEDLTPAPVIKHLRDRFAARGRSGS